MYKNKLNGRYRLFFGLGILLGFFIPSLGYAQVMFRNPISTGVSINNLYDNNSAVGTKLLYSCTSFSATSPDDNHHGVDFPVPTNTPISAGAAGKIYQRIYTCPDVGSATDQCGSRFGNHYRIDHAGDNFDGNGLLSIYAHMKASSVTLGTGSSVFCGQQLGQSAASGQVTGAHLHFELWTNGTDVNTKTDPFAGQCSHTSPVYWNSVSNSLPSTACQTMPWAPSNVTTSNPTGSSLRVNFKDNATTDSNTILERRIGSGTWSSRAVFNPLTGTQSWYYTDSGLSTGQSYCYRLRSLNGGGYSSYSNEACGIAQIPTLPAAPSNVSITNATVSSLRVNFKDNATNEANIFVDRRPSASSTWTRIITWNALSGAQSWYWNNTGLSSRTTYCYRVGASNSAGPAYSSTACGQTL